MKELLRFGFRYPQDKSWNDFTWGLSWPTTKLTSKKVCQITGNQSKICGRYLDPGKCKCTTQFLAQVFCPAMLVTGTGRSEPFFEEFLALRY